MPPTSVRTPNDLYQGVPAPLSAVLADEVTPTQIGATRAQKELSFDDDESETKNDATAELALAMKTVGDHILEKHAEAIAAKLFRGGYDDWSVVKRCGEVRARTGSVPGNEPANR